MTHQMTMCWHDAKPFHSKMTIFIVKMAIFEWKLLKLKYVLMNVYDFWWFFWQQTSVSSNMSLQIERIVESLVAICTFVFFVWWVISTMTIEHSNVLETLATDFTFKFGTMTVTSLDRAGSAWGRHWVLVMMIQACRWLKFRVRYESYEWVILYDQFRKAV